jgi:hypothetical protein
MDEKTAATRYEIDVRGVLSERLLSAFPEMQARPSRHKTALIGALADQSALHGILGRIEALGLELLEVRRVGLRGDAVTDKPGPAGAEGVDE